VSYLHCPSCQRAYNIAAQLACPHCGVRAGAPADATADVVAAAEQLARAMARATLDELAAAGRAIDQRVGLRALPAPGQTAITNGGDRARELLGAVRGAISPTPVAAPTPSEPVREPVITGRARHALLATVAMAVLTRIAPRPAARLAAPMAAPRAPQASRREGLASGLRRAARALLAFA
jgi:hypothetical protein